MPKRKCNVITEILRLSKTQPGFDADLREYQDYLTTKDMDDLERILHNKKVFCNPASMERAVEREIKRMDKAGLYNVGSMSPRHALD